MRYDIITPDALIITPATEIMTVDIKIMEAALK